MVLCLTWLLLWLLWLHCLAASPACIVGLTGSLRASSSGWLARNIRIK
jgi:hypothetical protein